MANPQRVVVVTMIGTTAIIVAARARKGELPTSRAVIGLGVVYLGLAAAAELAPGVAAPFAALVFTGTLLEVGGGGLKGVSDLVAGKGPVTSPDASSGALASASGPTLTGTVPGSDASTHGLVAVPTRYWAPGASDVRLRGDVIAQALSICDRFGLVITSGYRSVAHNASLSDSSPNSLHLCGAAADYVDRDGGTEHAVIAYNWALRQHFVEVEPWAASRDHLHIGFARC